jgi:hypothetical protein
MIALFQLLEVKVMLLGRKVTIADVGNASDTSANG